MYAAAFTVITNTVYSGIACTICTMVLARGPGTALSVRTPGGFAALYMHSSACSHTSSAEADKELSSV